MWPPENKSLLNPSATPRLSEEKEEGEKEEGEEEEEEEEEALPISYPGLWKSLFTSRLISLILARGSLVWFSALWKLLFTYSFC